MLIMTGKLFQIYIFCAATGHLYALNASIAIQGLSGDRVPLTIASCSLTYPKFSQYEKLWMESKYGAVY
jgi:hypothetical protein